MVAGPCKVLYREQHRTVKKKKRPLSDDSTKRVKTKQRAAVGVPGHRARSRARYTHNEPWWKEKRDPRSVPATTARCLDSRRKFSVHGRNYAVSQNIMITAVALIRTRIFSHLSIPYTSVRYKVEGTQYNICCASKYDYLCADVEPFFPIPTCSCTKRFTVYRKYVVCQNMITAVPVLLW